MRILHAPSNIANQAWLMAEGLRARGHHVEVWHYGTPSFDFPVDRVIEQDNGPATYIRTLVEALQEDFDVVHFHYARSLLPARAHLPWYWDLPVWRALDKKVFFTFHGSDVRLRSHHAEDDEWSYYRFADVPCDEERIASQLAVIRGYAHTLTVGSVLDLAYVPDALYVPRLVDTERLRVIPASRRQRPVLLHAPSKRATKGTEFVLSAVSTLQERGVAFDLDLVEGVSHSELMSRYASADIIVDQLLTGEIGVASLEAMALGRVSVARLRQEVLDQHPDLPVVHSQPDTLPDVLQGLLEAPTRREELAARGRAFVEANHDHRVVAQLLEELYSLPQRSNSVVYPGWTAPEPQKRLEAWQQKLERTEVANAALRHRVERLNERVAALERKLAAQASSSETTTAPAESGRETRTVRVGSGVEKPSSTEARVETQRSPTQSGVEAPAAKATRPSLVKWLMR
jgi:glycosyltransferase involved in cell wall biosynthesis